MNEDESKKVTDLEGENNSDKASVSSVGDSGAESACDVTDEAAGVDIEKLRSELEEYKNKWLRAEAELENYKKRTLKEKEEFKKFALETFIRDIIMPIDYLEMAIAHAATTKNVEALIQGVEYTHKNMLDILKNYGVETVTADGKRFDPATHEASEVVEDDSCEEGIVLKELRKAYLLHGRLIRAGLAQVSKKKESVNNNIELKEGENG